MGDLLVLGRESVGVRGRKTKRKAVLVLSMALVLLLCCTITGCQNEKPQPKPPSDSDDDGVPDAEDEYPDQPNWGVGLAYLDDTLDTQGRYGVDTVAPVDYGVLLINNTGVEKDSFKLEVGDATEGWTVELSKSEVTLEPEELTWVVVTYHAPAAAVTVDGDILGEESFPQTPILFSNIEGSADAEPSVLEKKVEGFWEDSSSPISTPPGTATVLAGQAIITLSATSQANPQFNASLELVLTVTATGAKVAETGDQVIVSYVLHDTLGNELDSGTLPATAGEPEAGPLGQLSYIDGFYLGLLGMKLQETKTVRVPPELAYGTDPDAHELGGEVLLFTLTVDLLPPI